MVCVQTYVLRSELSVIEHKVFKFSGTSDRQHFSTAKSEKRSLVSANATFRRPFSRYCVTTVLKIIAIVTSRHALRNARSLIDFVFERWLSMNTSNSSLPTGSFQNQTTRKRGLSLLFYAILLTCWTMTGVQREHARAELSKVYMLNTKNTLQGGTQKQLQKSDSQRPLVRHLVPCTEPFKMINFLGRDGMHQLIHAEKH